MNPYDGPVQLNSHFFAYLIYMVLYEGDEAHAYLLVAEARVLLRIEYRQCNGYLKREARIRPYEE